MGKKLYVGNLPFSTTEAGLGEFFAQAGEVESVKLITDRETGRSKGFGFIEMATDEQAQDAISRLHGQSMDGRTLTVSEARPMAPRTGGGGFGGGRSAGNDYGGGGGGFRRGGGGSPRGVRY